MDQYNCISQEEISTNLPFGRFFPPPSLANFSSASLHHEEIYHRVLTKISKQFIYNKFKYIFVKE
jgi:hypothetical protein